ncbi:hypothetical protein [Agromyces allii]|uniref:Uncharacterized protein n=1 Tax=Agromyces allii TaxID=393607 RepID=A0ABN2QT74_9MICO|nr:hypothetical protein [Agromyces allii]
MPKPSAPSHPSKAPTYLTTIGLTLTAFGLVLAVVMLIGALPNGLTPSEAALPVTVGLIWIMFGAVAIVVGAALRRSARKQAEQHEPAA